ncbi:MAG: hypothetical protein KUA43_15445 [Hoeflea sp.]|uniref:hypothetical protein n=1 Tax=Hoeflea sp. TaxID=1940281 RepID=UPI001D7717A2|nr:hypothetical protein [Hoeflea sp.]MBU4531557.1 hypothetical protein [Alphaproteobacteria bacterium]MBU4544414.1 hypothetical protein [Alphaproteobacteria bacterium]MBU4550349.1 hypothetical protein [Alphaproteobacteria bacterium]MBV1724833.1 hypothetical protein [Hoeflea sp.]MBV1760853.1 hypothetical protein [Hoeflea sp.]
MRGLTLLGALTLPLMLAATVACADPVRDFKSADTDGDGILEVSEFRRFVDLRADSGSKIAQRVRTFRAYGLALSAVDYDGDGKVSGAELIRYDKNS